MEPTHIVLILLVVLLFFGGRKIPELMHGVGKGMGSFQKGLQESKSMLNAAVDELKEGPPAPGAAQPADVPPPAAPAAPQVRVAPHTQPAGAEPAGEQVEPPK